MIEKKSKKEVIKALDEFVQKNKIGEKLNVYELEKEVFEGSLSDSTRLLTKVLTAFSKKNLSEEDQNKLPALWSDFWNYLPHKDLGGKTPYDMVKKAMDDDPSLAKKENNNEKEMTVCVGDKKMSESEFEKMIEEMEKEQAPFKKQIEKELLPAYEKFLQVKFKQKTADTHFRIAELFLERALFMGFIRYDLVKSGYAFYEFPMWWQSHVVWSLSETYIENSVMKFVNFVHDTFSMEIYDESLVRDGDDDLLSIYQQGL